MTDTDWYSDGALRKQAIAADLMASGEPVPLDVMCGYLEPRVPPAEGEECANCGCDARGEVGGEAHGGKRWCGICVGRGRHAQHMAEDHECLSATVQSIREWCDRTERAASGDQSEPVFQARMELVAEVRGLLPPLSEEGSACATTTVTSDPAP